MDIGEMPTESRNNCVWSEVLENIGGAQVGDLAWIANHERTFDS